MAGDSSESEWTNHENHDVVVIGGGSAGLCAAVAAARSGSRVALVERSNRLGGAGPLAFVHTFCGLYMPGVSKPPVIANLGLPEEIERRMRARTGQAGPTVMGQVYVLPQHPQVYDQLAKDLVSAESPRLDLMLESECTAIERCNDGMFKVFLETKHGRKALSARGLVDCSADAIAAELLGATRLRSCSEILQRPAFIFSLNNVSPGAADERFRMRLALDLVHAVRANELPRAALGATIRESVKPSEYFVSIDLDSNRIPWDPSSPEAVNEVETTGRELARKLLIFFRRHYPSFAQASDPLYPQSVGVRESFRWQGQYVLSADDLVDGKVFADAIANATWPIELRECARGAKFIYFSNEESSQIPLRALSSAEVPGVYFAGMCISATHEALASVRVMGTCFATGQAAGMAASLYASGVTEVDEQTPIIQARYSRMQTDS